MLSSIRCVVITLTLCIGAPAQTAVRSEDAYARPENGGTTWVLGTSSAEQTHRFAAGTYALTHLSEKSSGHDFITAGKTGEEFRLLVNGSAVSGRIGNWTWHGGKAVVLPQHEIQVTVELDNGVIQVKEAYVLYPGTGIIRHSVTYKNISSKPVRVENPYFLCLQLQPPAASKFYYMTGGGVYTGSQILKSVPLTPAYSRTFDTTDPPELIQVAGVKHGYANLRYGSGVYMPWFAMAPPDGPGLFAGLDYYGRWAAEAGNIEGQPGTLAFRLGGFKMSLAPGEEIQSPMAFTGVYAGDLDSMGNQLKDWQYRYLWDFTNPAYFGRIRFAAEMRWQADKGSVRWGGGTQDNWDYRMAAHLRAIDLMRSVGADVLWQDAGWHDHIGDNDGPDFELSNAYLKKSGMRLAVWWPLYAVARESSIYGQHPDWGTAEEGMTGGTTINAARPDVVQYMAEQLDQKVRKWGDFQWRLDSTPVVPVRGDETPMLEQYQNMMRMEKEFRRRHPESSIDVCAGGGNLMGFEALHVSDVSQLTDGGPMYISNYYSSYLFPPDKIDDWTRNSMFTFENAREILTMAPAWMSDRGLYGHEPGLMLNNGEENLRRTFEIYHYLLAQGVAGRWSHVYHPRVEGDDPVFYFERLSRDGRRGAIILKHFPHKEVKIYPKGLLDNGNYDIRFEAAKRVLSVRGSELMANGLVLTDPKPGELVYIGLPDYPGSGRDTEPPSDPAPVRKHVANEMGTTGVEIEWAPARDNNWLSRYRIYRDGEPAATIAGGTSYFDHSDGASNLHRKYEVQAVDGDGNMSRKITASEVQGSPVSYSAWSGFLDGRDYSYQGGNYWSFEEESKKVRHPLAWRGDLGQMGLYEGSAGDQRVLMGASWMRPAESSDAVRVFSVPYSGEIAITGVVHKDIYHLYGDGVRVKILQGERQIWPQQDWQVIAANDREGKDIKLTLETKRGDKLSFVVNANKDSTDDDTVWNPRITYIRIDDAMEAPRRQIVDDRGSEVVYSGTGWQHNGQSPWSSDLDRGYLAARYVGTNSVSGTPGDTVTVKFKGTGIEVIGDTGTDRGMAAIQLDGKAAGTIDTFLPENILAISRAHPSPIRESARIAYCPPTRIWGVRDLPSGEHTLQLIVLHTKNAQSLGNFIGVDAFVILGGAAVEAEAVK